MGKHNANPQEFTRKNQFVDYGVAHGCVAVSGKGSHTKLVAPNGCSAIVSGHSERAEIPVGTRHSILRQFKAMGILTFLGFILFNIDWRGLIIALGW